jgi:hypothetical protein
MAGVNSRRGCWHVAPLRGAASCHVHASRQDGTSDRQQQSSQAANDALAPAIEPQSGRFVASIGDVGLEDFALISGTGTYMSTTKRITSGDEWKYLNGLAGFLGRGMRLPAPH